MPSRSMRCDCAKMRAGAAATARPAATLPRNERRFSFTRFMGFIRFIMNREPSLRPARDPCAMVPSGEDNTMTLQRTMIAGVVLMMAIGAATGRAAGRLPAQAAARGAAPQSPGPAGRGAQPGMNMVPEEIPLWEGGAPGALGSADADKPTLTIYRASRRSSGTAVVIAPGGGYQNLAMDHEGRQVAAFFNSMGVSAFVLKYRLGPKYHHPVELGDAQRAIRIVRSRAQELGVLPNRIGMMGFSAGGHLASTAATHFDSGKADATDAFGRVGRRPDFLILGYAVVSTGADFAHSG